MRRAGQTSRHLRYVLHALDHHVNIKVALGLRAVSRVDRVS